MQILFFLIKYIIVSNTRLCWHHKTFLGIILNIYINIILIIKSIQGIWCDF
jgi:hypothetical protein